MSFKIAMTATAETFPASVEASAAGE